MLGAIIGDIVGSRFEWNNIKSKEFEFYHPKCFFTDDSVMSLAIAKSILESECDYEKLRNIVINNMVSIGRKYPMCGFGGSFYRWIMTDNHSPYNSYGNGAAMRVSACGFAASSLEDAKNLSSIVTEVSHNHPEGMKGAESVAASIYMAKNGKSIQEIKDYIKTNYYDIDFSLDDIRKNYEFNETCQNTVPQAFECFFEANSFEDAIRNAISIGGDSDTLGAIVGGMAEAYFGIPEKMRLKAIEYLDELMLNILNEFEEKYPPVIARMN